MLHLPGRNNNDEFRDSPGKKAVFNLPAANHINDASRRYAGMKSSLPKDPVCGKQRTSPVSLSQARHDLIHLMIRNEIPNQATQMSLLESDHMDKKLLTTISHPAPRNFILPKTMLEFPQVASSRLYSLRNWGNFGLTPISCEDGLQLA